MSQPCSLWSLHHLFLNFQYIFSSSSKSCKELAAKLKQEGNSPADKELILALAAVECGAPACSTASRAAPVFRCQRSSANAFCITTRARSQDGRLRHKAKMAKLRWPKGGVDALAKWLQAHPGHLPHLGLWIHRTFAKAATSLEKLLVICWGWTGGSVAIFSAIEASWQQTWSDNLQRVCPPSCSSSPLASLWHLCISKGMCWFAQSPTPLPGQLRGVPSQWMHLIYFKNYLHASELFACELGDGLPLTQCLGVCKAALKSHQRGAEIGATQVPSGQRCRGVIFLLVRLERWAVTRQLGRRIMVQSWFPKGRGCWPLLSVSPEFRVTERRRKEYYYLLQYQEISIP